MLIEKPTYLKFIDPYVNTKANLLEFVDTYVMTIGS